MSDWRDRIVTHDKILGGRPVFKGTRVSVEFVLSLMANGWTDDEILKNWPTLSQEDIVAAKGFSHHLVRSLTSSGYHKRLLEEVEGPVLQVTLHEDSTDAHLDEEEPFDLFDVVEDDDGDVTRVLDGEDIRSKLVAGVCDGHAVHAGDDPPDSDESE